MDETETSVRGLLEIALGEEPPIGPVARNSMRAGLKLRRRIRIRRAAGAAAAVLVVAVVIPAVTGAFGKSSAGPRAEPLPKAPTGTAYVITSAAGTVTPIDLATNTPGKPIDVSGWPVAIAVTPDGTTAYVASGPGATPVQAVTPIDLTTNKPGKPINLTSPPDAIVITPDGKTAYVINGFPSRTVTRIDLATNTAGKPITLYNPAEAIAMAPDGKTAYVATAGGTATGTQYEFAAFDLATSKLGTPVNLSGGQPQAIAIAGDGKTAYVLSQPSRTEIAVTPIDLAASTAGQPISFSAPPGPSEFFGQPLAIAIAPDGQTAYVANGASSLVTPIDLATSTPEKAIRLTGKPGADAIAISTNGAAAYVANQPSSTVTPINLTTDRPGKPIKIGSGVDNGTEAIVTVP
jgi:DNA-binding beta-propeller fold protein YncE